MAITSLEVAEMLGMAVGDTKYPQVVALLPFIQVQINDYCGGAFSRQVKEESRTFTHASSTSIQQLVHFPVVKGSVYVTSTDRGTYYYGDTQFGKNPVPSYYIPSTYVRDYECEYSTGGIYLPTTDSRIPNSTGTAYVTYSYVDLIDGGKVACARLIAQTINNNSGIASESVGTLSRSYSGVTGMDPTAKALLAPYRHPQVV